MRWQWPSYRNVFNLVVQLFDPWPLHMEGRVGQMRPVSKLKEGHYFRLCYITLDPGLVH